MQDAWELDLFKPVYKSVCMHAVTPFCVSGSDAFAEFLYFSKRRDDSWLLLILTTTFTSTTVAAPKASAAKTIPAAIFLRGLKDTQSALSHTSHYCQPSVCLVFWGSSFITLYIFKGISKSFCSLTSCLGWDYLLLMYCICLQMCPFITWAIF